MFSQLLVSFVSMLRYHLILIELFGGAQSLPVETLVKYYSSSTARRLFLGAILLGTGEPNHSFVAAQFLFPYATRASTFRATH